MGCIDYDTPDSDKHNNNEIEHFDQGNIRDSCHYMCSSFSYVNVIIIILILILIYHVVFRKKEDSIV
jgi:hypothetical protein